MSGLPNFHAPARITGMKIRVKMIANYRAALPPHAKNGVVELEVADSSTVFDVVSRFDIPLNDESVIVLNGLTVEMSTVMQEGDMVTAFSAIAGG